MYSKSDGFLCFHYLHMHIVNDTYHVVEGNGVVNAEGADHTLAHNSCMSMCAVFVLVSILITVIRIC